MRIAFWYGGAWCQMPAAQSFYVFLRIFFGGWHLGSGLCGIVGTVAPTCCQILSIIPAQLNHSPSFQKLYLCICVIICICIFLSGFLRCCQTLPIIPAPPSHLIFLQIVISQVSRLFPRALKYHRLSKTTCRGVALIGRRPRLIRLCPRHKLMDDTEQSWMRRYIDHQPTN